MNIDSTTQIFLGNTEILKIKKGNDTIWERGSSPTPTYPDYLYIQNDYNGENVISLVTEKSSSTPSSSYYSSSVQYSKDRENWTTVNFSTTTPYTITMNQGEKVYFRNDSGVFNFYQNSTNYYYTMIRCSQQCSAGGKPTSILNYNTLDMSLPYGAFSMLFHSNTGLTSAPFVLDYGQNTYCYNNMFRSCSNLVVPPTLPNTSVSDYAYFAMFRGCSSLMNPPALPATNLGNSCYNSMFIDCKFTTAPTLPATYVATSAYKNMFKNCTNLNRIVIYANSGTNGFKTWVEGVGSTGDFYKFGTISLSTGISGIPSGWTVHTTL